MNKLLAHISDDGDKKIERKGFQYEQRAPYLQVFDTKIHIKLKGTLIDDSAALCDGKELMKMGEDEKTRYIKTAITDKAGIWHESGLIMASVF